MARRCGYCGDSGHNRRTCNVRSPEAKKIDKTYHRKKACSYCSNVGHTRPKCERMDSDRAKWIADNAIHRSNFLADMKESGLGVGAIYRTDINRNYMVRRIHWEQVKHDDRYAYGLESVDMKTGNIVFNCLPPFYGLIGEEKERYKKWDNIEILIRASDEMCAFNIPDGWFTGNDGIPFSMIKKERKKPNEG